MQPLECGQCKSGHSPRTKNFSHLSLGTGNKEDTYVNIRKQETGSGDSAKQTLFDHNVMAQIFIGHTVERREQIKLNLPFFIHSVGTDNISNVVTVDRITPYPKNFTDFLG